MKLENTIVNDNEYTKDFLKTINKINNPYDLVLVYLALFEDLFDFNQSKFLTENDKVYKNQKHIQFNEYVKVIKESVELYE
jgi:hypothetical protein|tara:strand:+ start:94 stop:336 length:243 start_codon:yes stop_codon:yes gene_type:complete